MILSRRSFLKMAGLTVVAAAGASMFTGCGAFSTTPIKVVAAKDSTKEFQAAVAELNKKKLVVWPADANGAYLKGYRHSSAKKFHPQQYNESPDNHGHCKSQSSGKDGHTSA